MSSTDTNQASEDNELQANVLEIIELHFKPETGSLMPLNATKRILQLIRTEKPEANQASEDELSADDLTALLLDHFDNSMPVEVDRHYGEHLLYRLIRTEKLKLLAEVRERVGEWYPYCLNNSGRANTRCNKCWVCRHGNDEDYVDGYESAQDEIAKSLTKLEAEL